jgi:lipid-A-disaccharide synthase
MRQLASGDFHDWADEAVVGLWDVLRKYRYFKAQFDRMLADLSSGAARCSHLHRLPWI